MLMDVTRDSGSNNAEDTCVPDSKEGGDECEQSQDSYQCCSFLFKLSNGIQVLYTEDSKATSSAVALSVDVGSIDSPSNMQGIVHLIEHLFMVKTKKYLMDYDFDRFINENNGSENIFVTPDTTSFTYLIDHSSLEESLSRVSDCFTSPFLSEEDIKSEISIVRNEYMMRRPMEDRKLRLLRIDTSEETSSNCFLDNVQNMENLLKHITKEKVEQFIADNYTAERFRIVIVSNQRLEIVKRYLENHFGKIPFGKRDKEDVRMRKKGDILTRYSYHDEKYRGKLIKMKPTVVMDSGEYRRLLSVVIPLPFAESYYDELMYGYIAHVLGPDESQKGLANILKEKGYAYDLTTNISRTSMYYPLELAVTISLLPEGERNVEEVQNILKEYLMAIKHEWLKQFEYMASLVINHKKDLMSETMRLASIPFSAPQTICDRVSLLSNLFCTYGTEDIFYEVMNFPNGVIPDEHLSAFCDDESRSKFENIMSYICDNKEWSIIQITNEGEFTNEGRYSKIKFAIEDFRDVHTPDADTKSLVEEFFLWPFTENKSSQGSPVDGEMNGTGNEPLSLKDVKDKAAELVKTIGNSCDKGSGDKGDDPWKDICNLTHYCVESESEVRYEFFLDRYLDILYSFEDPKNNLSASVKIGLRISRKELDVKSYCATFLSHFLNTEQAIKHCSMDEETNIERAFNIWNGAIAVTITGPPSLLIDMANSFLERCSAPSKYTEKDIHIAASVIRNGILKDLNGSAVDNLYEKAREALGEYKYTERDIANTLGEITDMDIGNLKSGCSVIGNIFVNNAGHLEDTINLYIKLNKTFHCQGKTKPGIWGSFDADEIGKRAGQEKLVRTAIDDPYNNAAGIYINIGPDCVEEFRLYSEIYADLLRSTFCLNVVRKKGSEYKSGIGSTIIDDAIVIYLVAQGSRSPEDMMNTIIEFVNEAPEVIGRIPSLTIIGKIWKTIRSKPSQPFDLSKVEEVKENVIKLSRVLLTNFERVVVLAPMKSDP